MKFPKKTILIIFFVSLVFLALFFFGSQKFFHPIIKENPPVQLPPAVLNEIESFRADERSYFNRWEANSSDHLVTIYLNCSIRYTNMKPDKTIDGWTIRWIQDPELYNQTSIDAYETFIKNWAKMHPDQKIGYWDADPCKKRVLIALVNSSPENLGSKAMVDGWEIFFIQAT